MFCCEGIVQGLLLVQAHRRRSATRRRIVERAMQRFDNPDVIITDVLSSHGKWRADKPAIICGDTRLTWREFNSRINQVANGLIGLGLQKGDKVSLLMSNRPEMLEILFGAIRAGGVIVPLSVMVPGESLARMVVDSDSRFLFADSDRRLVMDPFRKPVHADSC